MISKNENRKRYRGLTARRGLSWLLALCLLAAALAGCGDGGESAASEPPAAEEKEETAAPVEPGIAEEINERTIAAEGSGVVDLTADRQWIFGEIRDMISGYGFPSGDLLNGRTITEEDRQRIEEARDLESLPEEGTADVRYGILNDNAAVRSFPTEETLCATGDRSSFDLFQESMFRAGEGVIVLHQAGNWLFVQGEDYYGWIPGDAVSFCSFGLMSAWLEIEDFLVVTDAYAEIPDTELTLRMGTRIPSVSADGDENARAVLPLAGDGADGYVTASDGKLVFQTEPAEDALPVRFLDLPEGSCRSGWEELTEENITARAEKLLGVPYGWGDGDGNMDCSSAVCSVFRCFGVILPRNSGDMDKTGAEVTDLAGMGTEEKLAFIESLPAGSVLIMNGHVMIYMGEKELDGETGPVILQEVTGYTGADGVPVWCMSCVETSLNVFKSSGESFTELMLYSVVFPAG
ncbi:MAG: SH3 domain-containing protein [Oscillospiraceae bacterium]|nr:SH3 domain-containing protein [Oscillospiraceae bacterium]